MNAAQLLEAHGVRIETRVHLVLTDSDGKRTVIRGANLIATAGDVHYAQKIVGESPTQFSSKIMELGAAITATKSMTRAALAAPLANSQKAIDATYPRTADNDVDNPDYMGGALAPNVLTYRVSYTANEAVGVIGAVIITNPSPGASEPVLMGGAVGPLNKTNQMTLKVFVNHTVVGG